MGLQEWGCYSSTDSVFACTHGTLSACDWMPVLALWSGWSLRVNDMKGAMLYNHGFLVGEGREEKGQEDVRMNASKEFCLCWSVR